MIHHNKNILMVLSKHRAINLTESSIVKVCQPVYVPNAKIKLQSCSKSCMVNGPKTRNSYLGCSSDHCGPTNINSFNAILKRDVTRGDFVIKGIQINHNHIKCPCAPRKEFLVHIQFVGLQS